MKELKGVDWNEVLQLSRLTNTQGQLGIMGRLDQNGIYFLPADQIESSAALNEASGFAIKLCLKLLKAGVVESSDTDTAYVPFVLPHTLSAEEFINSVAERLGVLPAQDVSVSIDYSGFYPELAILEHQADGDLDEYYELEEVKAIRAAAAQFNKFGSGIQIQVSAGHVAHLIVNLVQHSSGYWAGLATLRVDT